MSKKLVVILSCADWAGSQYQTCQAINSVGEFECRHITLFKHPHEYPTDVFMHLYPRTTTEHRTSVIVGLQSGQYETISDLLTKADIIHLWNTSHGEDALMQAGLPVSFDKVKVITMTGSAYRDYHSMINLQLAILKDCKVVVQDPMLKFEDEIESTFIPHAINVDDFKPQRDREKIVGVYRPTHKTGFRHGDEDISRVRELIHSFDGWRVGLDYNMPHQERMEKLSRCSLFIQDLSPYIGYWGRATLEASALEVPCMQNYDNRLTGKSEGKLGGIPLVKVELNTAEVELKKLIENEDYRVEVGRKSRQWVEDHYSYSVVGKMYSDLYRQML